MSNPAKDYYIRQDRKSREAVAERYTPVVLWVKPKYDTFETPDAVYGAEEIIRREIRDQAAEMPFTKVATDNEPRCEVVTEFDEDRATHD